MLRGALIDCPSCSVSTAGTRSKHYGGPEGPCQLPISTFSISNLEISRYRFPICRFIITNFTFSCYQFPICIFLVTKLKISHYQIVTKSSCYCRCPMYNYIHAHPKLLEGGSNTPVRACAVSAASALAILVPSLVPRDEAILVPRAS